MDNAEITVTITGPTENDRSGLAERINRTTNGRYVLKPRTSPVWVVCNDPSSPKAAKFIGAGSSLLSEAELLRFLEAGFLPGKKQSRERLPSLRVDWHTTHSQARPCRIAYEDDEGNQQVMEAAVRKLGTGENGHEYWLVYHRGMPKTLRTDRILEHEFL